MKKIISLTVLIALLFTSCSKGYNYDDPDSVGLVYSESMDSFSYNGNEYVPYENEIVVKYFHPFLTTFNRDEYRIDSNHITDARDSNINFICSEGGILRDLHYIRVDAEIPGMITDPEKIDSILICVGDNEYLAETRGDVSALIAFFSSNEIKALSDSGDYRDIEPENAVRFYGISGYYGGLFALERNLMVVWGEKIAIMNNGKALDLPDHIVDIVEGVMQNQSSGSVSRSNLS